MHRHSDTRDTSPTICGLSCRSRRGGLFCHVWGAPRGTPPPGGPPLLPLPPAFGEVHKARTYLNRLVNSGRLERAGRGRFTAPANDTAVPSVSNVMGVSFGFTNDTDMTLDTPETGVLCWRKLTGGRQEKPKRNKGGETEKEKLERSLTSRKVPATQTPGSRRHYRTNHPLLGGTCPFRGKCQPTFLPNGRNSPHST